MKIHPLKLILFFFGVLTSTILFSQNFENDEQKLLTLFEKIKFAGNDSQKDSINTEVQNLFEQILIQEGSFDYSFSTLQTVGIIKSSDNLLKIYNWNLFYEDGNHKYFGFVQYRKKKKKTPILYKLEDCSASINDPLHKELSNQKWYGALYYNIVQKKIGRKTVYTLMGWDGFDNYSNKKIIDILFFDGIEIKFGMPIINYENKKYNRLVFEFAEQAKMLLHFDKRYDMIIWDHLSPSNKSLEGKYEYYGPDFTQDGLFFENNEWQYYPNIKPKNQN